MAFDDATYTLKEMMNLQKQILAELKLMNKQNTARDKQITKPLTEALKNGMKLKGLK
mgnify:CR=1 FL=1